MILWLFLSTKVYVEILDENDNPPKFQEKEYTATVGDSLSWDPPSPILQVSATDPDFGLHSALLYSIVSGNVESEQDVIVVLEMLLNSL